MHSLITHSLGSHPPAACGALALPRAADQWERLCAARDSMMQIVSDVLAKYQDAGDLDNTTARIRMKQL